MYIYNYYSWFLCLKLIYNYHMPLLKLSVRNSTRYPRSAILTPTRYTLFSTLEGRPLDAGHQTGIMRYREGHGVLCVREREAWSCGFEGEAAEGGIRIWELGFRFYLYTPLHASNCHNAFEVIQRWRMTGSQFPCRAHAGTAGQNRRPGTALHPCLCRH
jgi:hypothetical protein